MKATPKKENNEKKMSRHVFRIPLTEDNIVSVSIEGKKFQLINIVEKGIGVLVDTEATFRIGQALKAIDLNLNEQTLFLQGKVMHLSPRDFQFICGIKFTRLTHKDEKKILAFLDRQKHKLFG